MNCSSCYIRALAALALSAAAVALRAQAVDTIDPALQARIDSIAAGVMQQQGVPSASVAVVEGGKLVYTHAYGLAHIDPGNSRHAGDALLHRLDLQAVHGRGDSAAAGAGQALAGRSRWANTFRA